MARSSSPAGSRPVEEWLKRDPAVFVSVGNARQGFHRLLASVDELAGAGVLAGRGVFLQIGNAGNFVPAHCAFEPFLAPEEFEIAISRAELVICHGGEGTIVHALHNRKVPVVMPRRRKYAEHVDDHQLELVRKLTGDGRVVPAYEPEDLPGAIREAQRRGKLAPPVNPQRLRDLVAAAIEEVGRP